MENLSGNPRPDTKIFIVTYTIPRKSNIGYYIEAIVEVFTTSEEASNYFKSAKRKVVEDYINANNKNIFNLRNASELNQNLTESDLDIMIYKINSVWANAFGEGIKRHTSNLKSINFQWKEIILNVGIRRIGALQPIQPSLSLKASSLEKLVTFVGSPKIEIPTQPLSPLSPLSLSSPLGSPPALSPLSLSPLPPPVESPLYLSPLPLPVESPLALSPLPPPVESPPQTVSNPLSSWLNISAGIDRANIWILQNPSKFIQNSENLIDDLEKTYGLPSSLKDGDIIDIVEHKGSGRYLVNMIGDQVRFHHFKGEYGYFVPSSGFKNLLDSGRNYYKLPDIEGIQIPVGFYVKPADEPEWDKVSRNTYLVLYSDDINMKATWQIYNPESEMTEAYVFENTAIALE